MKQAYNYVRLIRPFRIVLVERQSLENRPSVLLGKPVDESYHEMLLSYLSLDFQKSPREIGHVF